MNAQRTVDYSNLFASIDQMLTRQLPQLTLYFRLGRLLNTQPGKGAVAATAKYLAAQYPEMSGFSSRSLRRMRAFYRTYKSQPSTLFKAMRLGWTQNIVIFEADLTDAERKWYLDAAYKFGWSKLMLIRKIGEKAHRDPEYQKPAISNSMNGHIAAYNGAMHFDQIRETADIADFRLSSLLRTFGSPQVRRLDLKQIAYLCCPEIKEGRICVSGIRPLRDLNDIERIANLCWQKNESVFLAKNGYTNLVVMSIETYEQQMKVLDICRNLFTDRKQSREGAPLLDEDEVFRGL